MRGVVVIGGSAGSMASCRLILQQLPTTFALPLAVVIHAHPSQDDQRLEILRQDCRLAVMDVVSAMQLTLGTVFFAPPNYHLMVEADNTLILTVDEKVNFSRPSIDVLFESAADAFGGSAIGIVLSGANNDGAWGLKAIADAGGLAIIEDPTLATVDEMPRAALELVPKALVLAANEIGPFLLRHASALAPQPAAGTPQRNAP